MENKTYPIKINGVKNYAVFKDLTLDEQDEVNALFDKLGFVAEGNELTIQPNNKNLKIFLSKILVLENDVEITPEQSGGFTEDVSFEIMTDFFLYRIRKRLSMQKSFKESLQKQMTQSIN